MKILVVSDIEDKSLWDHFDRETVKNVDLIISCGDLAPEYLEFLVTMINAPLLYVHGNHDDRYFHSPPEGCYSIDGKTYQFQGLRIAGLGGAMKYREGEHMYTEKDMQKRSRKLRRSIRRMGGLDLLITHAPAAGHGDLTDLPHQGFDTFNKILDRWHPTYMLHGHVHPEYDIHFNRKLAHPSGTTLLNGYRHIMLDIKQEDLR